MHNFLCTLLLREYIIVTNLFQGNIPVFLTLSVNSSGMSSVSSIHSRLYASESELFAAYVRAGYPYLVIVQFLKTRHGVDISLRTFKARLRAYGIRRRCNAPHLDEVKNCIQVELNSPAANVGYRQMQRLLVQRYNLSVSNNTVMRVLSQLDPAGCARRRTRRFARRTYHCKGPNYTWHMDGWDKLKPYGISVHGCIDGFSRRVLWICACSTNKDPNVIASMYLDCVEELACCPKNLWSDAGTENVAVAAMQSALAGTPDSHRYVTSVRNQRIESWWGYLMRAQGHWWREFFEDMCAFRLYNPAKYFERNCLQ